MGSCISATPAGSTSSCGPDRPSLRALPPHRGRRYAEWRSIRAGYPDETRRMNIGRPKRVFEVEPVSIPVPEVLPEPEAEPVPQAEPVPVAEPVPAAEPAAPSP
jgi:hypothetical protein